MTERLRAMGETAAGSQRPLDFGQLDQAAKVLFKNFDSAHGGFGSAPKFPHPMDLRVLLRQYGRTGDDRALHAVKLTLDKMARGGIYDHLGGGFAGIPPTIAGSCRTSRRCFMTTPFSHPSTSRRFN